MNLAVVFKCYSITNNYGLNNKFSSYSWDAIINRKKHWSPAPARTLQDGIKENSTLHLYRTASYSNSLIFFTGYKCKKGKIISSFIIKYSLWCVNLLISEILKSVCVFPEFVTRLKRSVSKQATEQSWSKYFLNFIAFLSFKTSWKVEFISIQATGRACNRMYFFCWVVDGPINWGGGGSL